MRRYYKKPYFNPKRQKPQNKAFKPLLQPSWDDTIHDLTQMKLSPEEVMQRKLSRISKNQLGVSVLAQHEPLSGTNSARYSPELASDEESDGDVEVQNVNTHHSIRPASNSPIAMHVQHHYPARRSNAQAAAFDSEDDLCQWGETAGSPVQQQRVVLQEIGNSSGVAASCSCAQQQQEEEQQGKQAASSRRLGGKSLVDATALQVLLDKIDALEAQLQRQQQHQAQAYPEQQPSTSQQGLQTTQQQLACLQEEHRQYVAHSSSLLTRLQAQLQQLLGQKQGLMLETAEETNALHACNSLASSPVAGVQSPMQSAAAVAATQQPSSYNTSNASTLDAIANTGSASTFSTRPYAYMLSSAAVASTASPKKAQHGCSSSLVQQQPDMQAIRESSGNTSTAARGAAEKAALPSYTEMRQRVGACSTAARSLDVHRQIATATRPGHNQSSQCHNWLPPFSRPVSPPIQGRHAANAATSACSESVGNAIALGARYSDQYSNQSDIRPSQHVGRWSNAAQVGAVVSEQQQSSPAALPPACMSLPGLYNVDWGLQPRVLRSAVGKLYTAAGQAEDVEGPRPTVRLEQLQGNMSLKDHLRAAQQTLAGSILP